MVTGGTDLHLLLVDLRPLGLDGSRFLLNLRLCDWAMGLNGQARVRRPMRSDSAMSQSPVSGVEQHGATVMVQRSMV